jgi:hypothetical protein
LEAQLIMRHYQVDVHFLPEINPNAQHGLEMLGMRVTEERHGLVRGWMGARNEQHALDIARDALEILEDGDVQIIKPSPEPSRHHASEARRPPYWTRPRRR